jgi:hypothetical protein
VCILHCTVRAAIDCVMSNVREIAEGSEKAAAAKTDVLCKFLNTTHAVNVSKETLRKMVECADVDIDMLLDREATDEDFLLKQGWMIGQIWRLDNVRKLVESGEQPAKRKRCGVKHSSLCRMWLT